MASMVTFTVVQFIAFTSILASNSFLIGAFIWREMWVKKYNELVDVAKNVDDEWRQKYLAMNDRWADAWETNIRKIHAQQVGMIQKIADGGN